MTNEDAPKSESCIFCSNYGSHETRELWTKHKLGCCANPDWNDKKVVYDKIPKTRKIKKKILWFEYEREEKYYEGVHKVIDVGFIPYDPFRTNCKRFSKGVKVKDVGKYMSALLVDALEGKIKLTDNMKEVIKVLKTIEGTVDFMSEHLGDKKSDC